MFKRKILNHLKTWKNKPNRKPLILRGARQVGKTSVLKMFGHQEFEQIIYLNLEKVEHRRLFGQEMSLNELETTINTSLGQKLIPQKTLLIIDEIQQAPHLVNMLRWFYEEKPNLHVTAAGSLFEVKLKEAAISIPVGRVEYAFMYPMTFDEFLQSKGETDLLTYLNQININSQIPPSIHQQAIKLFQTYALIGGMPEAVDRYIKTNDLTTVNQVFAQMMTSFSDDIYKYSSQAQSKYLLWVLEHAPLVAGSTITYDKFAGSEFGSREMNEAFSVLEKAMLLYRTSATRSKNLPITPVNKKPPKLLWLDIGIINQQMGIQSEYLKTNNLIDLYQGRLSEQIVGQHLMTEFVTDQAKLWYWFKSKESEAEVDFCVQIETELVGIEVKSGTSGRLKSLQEFVKSTAADRALRIYAGELSKQPKQINSHDWELVSLPFYLLYRWRELWRK